MFVWCNGMLEALRKSRCLNSSTTGSWPLNTQPRGILPHLSGGGSLGYSLADNIAHYTSERSGRRWRNTCLTHLVQNVFSRLEVLYMNYVTVYQVLKYSLLCYRYGSVQSLYLSINMAKTYWEARN